MKLSSPLLLSLVPLLLTLTPPRSGADPVRLTGFPAGPAAPPATATAPPLDGERSWPIHVSNPIGSPAFYDLDGDGIAEVIAGDDGRVYVFDAAGNPRPGWPRGVGHVDQVPAFADLDGDGSPEVIVTVRGAPPKIWAFRANGTTMPGWPVSMPYQSWMNVSCPVVADLDGDGRPEVGAASELGVAFFRGDGQPLAGWPYLWTTSQNIQWSGPAVGDLDGDGRLEVVVGDNRFLQEGVHAIRADGTPMNGWPQSTYPIFSSAALADLDRDGKLEIIIQEGDAGFIGHRLFVWRSDGTSLPGWPKTICADFESSRCSPAIADVDGDGALEIVTVTSDGYLHILRADGTYLPGYPRLLPAVQPITSPSVVDVNGDGREEIFLTYYAAGNQYVSGWTLQGALLLGFPKLLLTNTQLDAHGSCHVADMDGDGRFELVAMGTDLSNGSLCLFDVDQSVYVPNVTRVDWPKIRRDARNTGLFPGRNPGSVRDAADARGAGLVITPNPVVSGGVLRVDPAARGRGRLILYDVAGRAIAERALPGPTALPVDGLLGGPRRGAGTYVARWEPAGAGVPRSARIVVLER